MKLFIARFQIVNNVPYSVHMSGLLSCLVGEESSGRKRPQQGRADPDSHTCFQHYYNLLQFTQAQLGRFTDTAHFGCGGRGRN